MATCSAEITIGPGAQPSGFVELACPRISRKLKEMADLQGQYDEAMFAFSSGNCEEAITRLRAILKEDPNHFEAQLALGGAYFAKGDFAAAIAEGHKAEKMQPHDQMAHTNLSRAYMRAGDKPTAEHHAVQARIASWRGNMAAPGAPASAEAELQLAKPAAPPPKVPEKFPDMPWKKK
jgi:predicted Zn-dependent protease